TSADMSISGGAVICTNTGKPSRTYSPFYSLAIYAIQSWIVNFKLLLYQEKGQIKQPELAVMLNTLFLLYLPIDI
ncbi:MAG: hypothetical protein IKL31_01195, partial [Ruminococcus sp.]|nr:hypothetical protein [Ruminococcus sp.]